METTTVDRVIPAGVCVYSTAPGWPDHGRVSQRRTTVRELVEYPPGEWITWSGAGGYWKRCRLRDVDGDPRPLHWRVVERYRGQVQVLEVLEATTREEAAHLYWRRLDEEDTDRTADQICRLHGVEIERLIRCEESTPYAERYVLGGGLVLERW